MRKKERKIENVKKQTKIKNKIKQNKKKNLSSTKMKKGAEETCPIIMTSISVGVRAFSSLGTTE